MTGSIGDFTDKILAIWDNDYCKRLFKDRNFTQFCEEYGVRKMKVWLNKPDKDKSTGFYVVKKMEILDPVLCSNSLL